jgi:hypothetical protein
MRRLQASGQPPAWPCKHLELAMAETPDIGGMHLAWRLIAALPGSLQPPPVRWCRVPVVRVDCPFLLRARPVEGDLRTLTLLMGVRRLRRQGRHLTINHVAASSLRDGHLASRAGVAARRTRGAPYDRRGRLTV